MPISSHHYIVLSFSHTLLPKSITYHLRYFITRKVLGKAEKVFFLHTSKSILVSTCLNLFPLKSGKKAFTMHYILKLSEADLERATTSTKESLKQISCSVSLIITAFLLSYTMCLHHSISASDYLMINQV